MFLDPTAWDNDWHEARDKFLAQYGVETVRRLLMFVFDFKRIDFNGFTEEQLNDALSEAQWFVIMTSVHVHAQEQGDAGIEFRITGAADVLETLSRGSA